MPVQPHIAELEIAAHRVSSIREDLALIGYDRARVFPELATVAERVLRAGEQASERWEPENQEE